MTEIPGGIYEIANAADLVCQKGHCQRGDCNGFLCREAIDAVFLAAEKRGEERERERCAKVAESHFDLRHADRARFASMSIAAAIRKGSD